ncbi:hypothetical protein Tco_1501662 [Tanacetum coccineum]
MVAMFKVKAEHLETEAQVCYISSQGMVHEPAEKEDEVEALYMGEGLTSSKKFLVSNFINYKMTDSRPVLKQYNELLGILGRFTQHKINMDESIQVSCIIDKLSLSWKDFKHTLKHLKEELTLVELGSHLRIEESLRMLINDKPKWIAKVEKSGNKANGSVDGSTNSLKGQNMFNKSFQVYYVTYVFKAYYVQDDDVAWWVNSGATVHDCNLCDEKEVFICPSTSLRMPNGELKTGVQVVPERTSEVYDSNNLLLCVMDDHRHLMKANEVLDGCGGLRISCIGAWTRGTKQSACNKFDEVVCDLKVIENCNNADNLYIANLINLVRIVHSPFVLYVDEMLMSIGNAQVTLDLTMEFLSSDVPIERTWGRLMLSLV